jgi:hypothetical protein
VFPDVHIGSATEWDRLIAECEIDKKIGFIVSDEEPGNVQVSLFVFPHDEDDFAFSRKQAFRTVSLETLLFLLDEARDRLTSLRDREGPSRE